MHKFHVYTRRGKESNEFVVSLLELPADYDINRIRVADKRVLELARWGRVWGNARGKSGPKGGPTSSVNLLEQKVTAIRVHLEALGFKSGYGLYAAGVFKKSPDEVLAYFNRLWETKNEKVA